MQQIEAESGKQRTPQRQRVEAVVETLATLHSEGESLAEMAHDARNMVTALGLYCDLLEEPGVLAPAFAHYGSELRLVAAASRRLVEKLVALDDPAVTQPVRPGAAMLRQKSAGPARQTLDRPRSRRHWHRTRTGTCCPPLPIDNLAAELLANRNLLSALAGPAIALAVDTEGGAQPVRITGEDLTRVLVNLVKNAAEAMPAGGRIQIALRERSTRRPRWQCAIEDNGPGISADALEQIFESGYTAHAAVSGAAAGRPAAHRGLGLAISRSIVEAAGGRMYAENCALGGARMVMELPVP